MAVPEFTDVAACAVVLRLDPDDETDPDVARLASSVAAANALLFAALDRPASDPLYADDETGRHDQWPVCAEAARMMALDLFRRAASPSADWLEGIDIPPPRDVVRAVWPLIAHLQRPGAILGV